MSTPTMVNGELVTWRKVLILMAICVATPITASWAMLDSHEAMPTHNNAVSSETFAQLDKRLADMAVDIREIRKRLP